MTADLIRQSDLSQVRETLMRHITLMQERIDELEASIPSMATEVDLPVGTLYMSYDPNFDPNVQWPGTVWENFGDSLHSPLHYMSGTGTTGKWPTNAGSGVRVTAICCTIWHRVS